jgi:hypothetical protein
MLISDATAYTAFLAKYNLGGLTVNSQAVLQAWVVGTDSIVYSVKENTGNYYFLHSIPANTEPSVYTTIEILFLDTTAETISVTSSTVVKTSSVKDCIDCMEDYFSSL